MTTNEYLRTKLGHLQTLRNQGDLNNSIVQKVTFFHFFRKTNQIKLLTKMYELEKNLKN